MIYEIKNENLHVKVNSLGAELINCTGNDGYEYIHQPSKEWVGQAKNMFPTIAQTKDNFILVKGEKYKAQQHGFAKDMEFALVSKSENELCFVLESNDETKEFLPYDFKLYISFKLLENDLTQTYKIENCTEDAMYFSIGSHTGFYAPQGSYFDFGTNGVLTEIKRKDMMFLTGKSEKYVIKDGVLPILKDTYNHGADILTGFNDKKIALKNNDGKHTVIVDFTQFSYLGLWAPENSQIAVSIMPWCGLPDAQDTTHDFEEKQGNVRLSAKETYSVKQVLSFIKN